MEPLWHVYQPIQSPSKSLIFFLGSELRFFVWHSLIQWWTPAAEVTYSPPSFSPSRKITGMHPALSHSACGSSLGPLLGSSISISFQEQSLRIFHRTSWKSVRNWGGGGVCKERVFFPLSPKGKFEPTVCLSFHFIQPLLWEIRKGKARIVWNRLRSKLCC